MKKIIWLLFLIIPAFSETIYIDSALTSDSTATYNYTTHGTDGSNGRCYIDLQPALDYGSPGDSILMRTGTYVPTYRYTIKTSMNGIAWTSGNYSYLGSVAGEWAILDGENNITGGEWHAVLGSGDETNGLAYWMFERFEIKNGENQDNSSARGFFGNYGPFHFRYIIFRDNICSGGSGNIPAGFSGHNIQNSIFEYCWFDNNGSATDVNDNSGHIIFYGPYNWFTTTYYDGYTDEDRKTAVYKNIIRYNLFTRGVTGIRDTKSAQMFCGRHPETGHGYDNTYKTYGDNIHHNIFIGNSGRNIIIHQDFCQVHHNISDSSGDAAFNDDWDEVHNYKVCLYNNTVINADVSGIANMQGYDTEEETGEFTFHSYSFNNLCDTIAVSAGREEFTLITNATLTGLGGNQDSFFVSNNYSYRPTNSSVFYHNGQYTISGYQAIYPSLIAWTNNGSTELWTGTTGASKYIPISTHVLNGDTTVSNGGIGGSHWYLDGVTIPSYVGAVDPTGVEDTTWVATVLSLSGLGAGWEGAESEVYDTVSWARSDTGKIGVSGKQFYKRVEYYTSPSGYCKCYLLKDAEAIDSSAVLSTGLDDTLSNGANGTGDDYKIYCRTARATE